MEVVHTEFLDLLKKQVQYVVPRWQRRYCWGQTDIERLVDDLLAIADAESTSSHYGGTLITYQKTQPAGLVTSRQVVDGQQRLTTVSLLIAAIAEHLGSEDSCGHWDRHQLVYGLLLNQNQPDNTYRKLRLQNADDDEYRRCLEVGAAEGPGAVAQAYKVIRRKVGQHSRETLLRGLERFRVVSIGLGPTEDPQQIFQSINATGRPLTESEKVKNSLLMGLPDREQQDIHDTHWRAIEDALDAHHSSDPIDLFLRDFLRWQTGELFGIKQVYERFRRWTLRNESDSDRAALAERLARLARQYGVLIGTKGAGPHQDRDVERELVHIRALRLETHRPFTLRLLDEEVQGIIGRRAVAQTLKLVSTWLTRTWLADRPQTGLNKAFAEWARLEGPQDGKDVAAWWTEQLHRRQVTGIAVPTDKQVSDGIANRKAYGGSTTPVSLAVLCWMMEQNRPDEAPDRKQLTVEHILPRTLTQEWRKDLGPDAEQLHGEWRNRLANLTLSGNSENPRLGNMPFEKKKTRYCKSPIGLTRSLAEEDKWDEAALKRRTQTLIRLALDLWPWKHRGSELPGAQSDAANFYWRMEHGEWHEETTAAALLLNVARALIDRDPEHAGRLTGDSMTLGIHSRDALPPEDSALSSRYLAVPKHPRWMVEVHGSTEDPVERCRRMGDVFDVAIEIETPADKDSRRFWQAVQRQAGGLIGQKESWRRPLQGTGYLTSRNDEIVFCVGDPQEVFLYVYAGKDRTPENRIKTIREVSWQMQNEMADQRLSEDVEKQAEKSHSIRIVREWDRDDEDQWPDVARWLQDQQNRVKSILEKVVGERTELEQEVAVVPVPAQEDR